MRISCFPVVLYTRSFRIVDGQPTWSVIYESIAYTEDINQQELEAAIQLHQQLYRRFFKSLPTAYVHNLASDDEKTDNDSVSSIGNDVPSFM